MRTCVVYMLPVDSEEFEDFVLSHTPSSSRALPPPTPNWPPRGVSTGGKAADEPEGLRRASRVSAYRLLESLPGADVRIIASPALRQEVKPSPEA